MARIIFSLTLILSFILSLRKFILFSISDILSALLLISSVTPLYVPSLWPFITPRVFMNREVDDFGMATT